MSLTPQLDIFLLFMRVLATPMWRSLPPTLSVIMQTSWPGLAGDRDRLAAVLAFVNLVAQRRFCRGQTFHRVAPIFGVQGGNILGNGGCGQGYPLRSDLSPEGKVISLTLAGPQRGSRR